MQEHKDETDRIAENVNTDYIKRKEFDSLSLRVIPVTEAQTRILQQDMDLSRDNFNRTS